MTAAEVMGAEMVVEAAGENSFSSSLGTYMRLNFLRTAVLAASLSFLVFEQASLFACGLSWSPPLNHFDGVNEYGFASYWSQIDAVDCGNNLKLPLIINFSSDRNSSSPYLGSGWLLPLLESCIYQVDEWNFVMVEPDGANRYFHRSDPQDLTLTDKAGWAAKIDGNTITAWANCGWKLVFSKGQLVSMTSPENRRFDWIRAGDKVMEIQEAGVSKLAVKWDEKGEARELQFNGKSILIARDQKPDVQSISGKNIISSVNSSLSKLTLPNGSIQKYEFGVDEQLRPTLNADGRAITWDPASKYILSDGDWNYNIQSGEKLFDYAAISRQNSKKQSESWHMDLSRGTEEVQGVDGKKTITSWFVSGNLAGKIRKIEEVSNKTVKIIQQCTYDEDGKPIRISFPDGTTDIHSYSSSGTKIVKFKNNKQISSEDYDEHDRPKLFIDSQGNSRKYVYNGNNFEIFYIDFKGRTTCVENYANNLLTKRDIPGVRVETMAYLPGTDNLSEVRWNDGSAWKSVYNQGDKLTHKIKNQIPN